MRSNIASPPIVVGAMPVSMKLPKSSQRSRVTVVHSFGASGETSHAHSNEYQYYCGIDLPARILHLGVLNRPGENLFQRPTER